MQYASYVVCKEYLVEVLGFLNQFFERVEGKANHDGWITFRIPRTNFLVNLMKGEDQDITQNMTFETYHDSPESLQEFARKHGVEIKSFLATKTAARYVYHFCEVIGPNNICKIEASYSEYVT